jgi:hypothetical protein
VYSFVLLFQNPILITAVAAWFSAQTLKIIVVMVLTKKIDFKRFISAGGMPSSHSALVTSMATAIGKIEGWSSPITALAVVVALIVMYDAAGVRRSAGKQAEVINKIIEEFLRPQRLIKEERLKELIGHTPTEVFAGGILGIIIANILI